MPILVKPTLACNFACDYCYEHTVRAEGVPLTDASRLKAALIEHMTKCRGTDVVFHGGEITILPRELLCELFELVYAAQSRTAVMTNAYAIDDGIIELFKRYKCGVGVSVDGPWPINSLRGKGTLEERKVQHELVMSNIRRMREAGLPVSIISVITKQHMSPQAIEQYTAWLYEMKAIGVTNGRMNLVEGLRDFTDEEAARFYTSMADVVLSDKDLMWKPFRDFVDILLGLGTGSCATSRCNYHCTQSALVIHGDGSVSNCLRSTLRSGIRPRQQVENIRPAILSMVPWEHGGCKDCRYFTVCGGLCPSEGLGGEWKNRSEFCGVFKPLWEHIEGKLRGLMPNIQLAIDTDEDNFDKRRCGNLGDFPFQRMLPQYNEEPSTWKRPRMRAAAGWEYVGRVDAP
ncbi:MAG: radical SAM protein [Bacillota bacterium]